MRVLFVLHAPRDPKAAVYAHTVRRGGEAPPHLIV